jgi:hypothetical protein
VSDEIVGLVLLRNLPSAGAERGAKVELDLTRQQLEIGEASGQPLFRYGGAFSSPWWRQVESSGFAEKLSGQKKKFAP